MPVDGSATPAVHSEEGSSGSRCKNAGDHRWTHGRSGENQTGSPKDDSLGRENQRFERADLFPDPSHNWPMAVRRSEKNPGARRKNREHGRQDRIFCSAEQVPRELKASTIPKGDYITLQNQFSNFVPRETFEEMQKSFAQTTVPREQLIEAEKRMQDLETRIANSIPRSDHEVLVARITSLIAEAPRPSDGIQPPVNNIVMPAPLVTAGS